MQDFASEFQKFFGGDTPEPSQQEWATPSHAQHSAQPLAGTGRKHPSVGTQTLVPLNFSAVVAPLHSTTLTSTVPQFATSTQTELSSHQLIAELIVV